MTARSNQEILELRAKKLAGARAKESILGDSEQINRYLIVVCGAERFAIALNSIAEMFKRAAVTPLPKADLPLWGLTSWRGSILPVIVLGTCRPAQNTGIMIVLAVGQRVVAGLWADDVEGEAAIHPDEIHSPETSRGGHGSTLAGVTTDARIMFDVVALTQSLDERGHGSDRRAVDNSKRDKQ